MKDGKKLTVIGLSYRTSEVELRERYQISRKEIREHLIDICSATEIEGVVIVSTCNRIEFYLVHDPGLKIIDSMDSYFRRMKGVKLPPENNYYHYEDIEAVEHLFNVIAGLDSMVLGEYQIQGQVKEAYSHSCEARTVCKLIHKIFHGAFRAGKAIRNETNLGAGRHSVSGVASQIIIDNISSKDTISIIGVNENSRIVADNLIKNGLSNFIFLNRTVSKAQELAEQKGGIAYGLEKIESAMSRSKAVFTSTGAEEFLVTRDILLRLTKTGRCPKLMIDMAVPRDIDTADLNDQSKVYTINDLQNYLRKQELSQSKELPKAYEIIRKEVEIIKEWDEHSPDSIIGPYAEKFEMTRQQLMNEMKRNFSETDRQKADKLTKMLMHRMQSVFVKMLIDNGVTGSDQ